MSIVKLKFQDTEETSIQVTTDSGPYSAAWPCQTWHREEIEAAIANGLTIEPWKTAEEIKEEAISSKTIAIKAMRDERTQNGGFRVTVDGVNKKWFHSDTKSRAQQLALAQAAGALPADLQWKTMDGSYVLMTSDLAKQIVSQAIYQESATYLVAETHLAALLASQSPEEYVYTTGWPSIYGEE